jgi:hypothetical protein
MCFSRRSHRPEEAREVRKDPVWDLFDRETRREPPRSISETHPVSPEPDREREERPLASART